MHRSGRSAALNLRNHFGGHSVMVAVIGARILAMHVVGVDTAPKKSTTLFDRQNGWREIEAFDLPAAVIEWSQEESFLACWDAPLTIGMGHDRFYERPIESFFRNHREFTTPEGISIRPFSGCPHWAITHASLRLPRTNSTDEVQNQLPLSFIAEGKPPQKRGAFVVEVHPAVAIWLWCRDALPDGPWTYKKLKRSREIVWDELQRVIPDHLPDATPKDDDQIDSLVACVLGELWVASGNVELLGDNSSGSFLLPAVDGLPEALQRFIEAR
jgi:hypothetical protein